VARRAPTDLRGWLRFGFKQTRRFLTYWLAYAPLTWLLEWLPMAVIRWFLRKIVEPIVIRTTRARSLRHLRLAMGDELTDERREEIARGVVRHFLDGVAESLLALRNGPETYEARLEDTAARTALATLQATTDRGFVGVTGHIGNWELMGQWLSRHDPRGLGAVVAKRMTNPWLNAHIERLRRRIGLETFYRDDDPRRALRLLRGGKSIATVPDQDVRYLAGMFVEFFGRPAYTPIGPARLALAADVPIICGFFLRRPEGRFELVVSEPIFPDRSRPRDDEIERLTHAWSAEVEKVIRANPEQWAWFHERWRTTPERLAQRGQSRRAGGDPEESDA
jgi:KDO2-lipid IV(A) lauroyltransferase